MPLPYCYEHPRPSVTVDLVVSAFDGDDLRVLLIKRKGSPHAGRWALPGGFMEIDERLQDAARRELFEETGLEVEDLNLLGIFDKVKRDPRGRVLSVAYSTSVRWPTPVQGRDDADAVSWVPLGAMQRLAFDHQDIVASGIQWLSTAVLVGPAAFALLPQPFALHHVASLFDALNLSPDLVESWLERHRDQGVITPIDQPSNRRRATKRRIKRPKR